MGVVTWLAEKDELGQRAGRGWKGQLSVKQKSQTVTNAGILHTGILQPMHFLVHGKNFQLFPQGHTDRLVLRFPLLLMLH